MKHSYPNAKQLQTIRLTYQESIHTLAQALNTTPQIVDAIENEKTLPSEQYIQLFAQHYQIPLGALLLNEPIKRCIYPGSFDPITNGHIDIIKRASQIFDQVIIGVAYAHHKHTLFSPKARFNLVKKVLDQTKTKAIVLNFDGLLINFCQQQQCFNIVRGVRVISDFDYEFQLAWANQILNEHIETIFLAPKPQNTRISGKLVREIAKLGGDISAFIPESIIDDIQKKCIKKNHDHSS